MSSSHSSSSFSTSTSRNDYQTIRTLGSGAFGTVYLCQYQPSSSNSSNILLEDEDDDMTSHKSTNKQMVALKETYQDMKYKNREAEVLKTIKHPGIVKVFDIFYTKKNRGSKAATYLNIAMEYFPGTLHEVIERHKHQDARLSYQDIRWYTLQLFRTVGYLETLSLCHRDIKPHNILVDHNKKLIKMCDFGSAKKLIESESNKHYICSRFYRAPELLGKSTHYSCSVDLWSTGCCMAEMYLSQPLFNGSNTAHQLKLIRNVLGEFPENYPSRTRTNYAKRRGIASLAQWKKTLKLKENKKKLQYPEGQLNDVRHCQDLRFIRAILQYNPDKRYSLKQTLAHPYFKPLVSPTNQERVAMEQNGYRKIQWTLHEQGLLQKISSEAKQ